MISLDLAQKLKDAGLQWTPQDGDFFVTGIKGMENIYVVSSSHDSVPELGGKRWFFCGHLCNRDGGCYMSSTTCHSMNMNGITPERFTDGKVCSVKDMLFLPRLDQMLVEIEERNQRWTLKKLGDRYWCRINESLDASDFDSEIVNTVDNAVAEALLYVMDVYGIKESKVLEDKYSRGDIMSI